MKILITGSEGRIGKILARSLAEHQLTLLDKEPSAQIHADILTGNISRYFSGIETVIHLAAHTEPWATEQQGKDNVEMMKKVLEAIKGNLVGRLIFASSIDVYPYLTLFSSGKRITPNTETTPQLWQGRNFYGCSKLECEELARDFYWRYGLSVVNLRLGSVTEDDTPSCQENGKVEPVDYAILLRHRDLVEIVKRALDYNGFTSLVCVSNNKEDFVDLSPIERKLKYPIRQFS